MRGAPDRGQDGFTLVEMLVAITILAFVALGIAGLFSHSITVNASGHDYAQLAAEARVALETLQALPFTDPAVAQTGSNGRTMAASQPGFNITYSVEDFLVTNWTEASAASWNAPPGGVNANVKRITLTVESTNRILEGRRVFTVSSLKIPG